MARRKLPGDLVTKFAAALGEHLETLDDIEGAIEDLKAQIAQEAFDKRLAELPPEDDAPKPCPRCGRLVPVHTQMVAREIISLAGTHTLLRNYHRCKLCKVGFFPRDAALGIPSEGRVTLKLEARLIDFGVTTTYNECAERWEVHYPHLLFSENMFRRVSERVGERLDLADPRVLQETLATVPTGLQDRLYIQNDGGMLPMLEGRWSEAKVAALVRQEICHGTLSSTRYVAILGDQETFKQAVRAALDAEKWQRFTEIVWMADGAAGNWTLAEALCPNATQILDFTHALEHGVACGRAMLSDEDPALADWQRTVHRLLLTPGGVDILVAELMNCLPETHTDEQLGALNDLVRYCRSHQARMNYASYLERELMIGTGIVEGAHRHVLQERMKRSGQHWSTHHGARMAKLRAAYKTAGPKCFHARINKALCVTYQRAKSQVAAQAA